MKANHTLRLLAAALTGLLLTPLGAKAQIATSTAFSYQGILRENNIPATGQFTMLFQLLDTSGQAVGAPVTRQVTAADGVFTTTLDFGQVFNGSQFLLQMSVRRGTTGQFVLLLPAQPITAAPMAVFAQAAASVPASGLPSNIPRTDQPATFTSVVRLMQSGGPGALRFGPTDDCSIGIDTEFPGLLLRDPKGIRILSPDPAQPPVLRFGPTDDCSLGINPALPGLIERDPTGFRLLGQNSQGCRLIFGPTMDCTIEIRPPGTPDAVAGLLLRDPRGIRILSPDPLSPPVLRFGPTDDCSLGIDPATPGLLLRDPSGIRILSPLAQQPPVLRFGPTDDCSIGISPNLTGLLLRDPSGLRLVPPSGAAPTLRFGPTDDCSLGIDPATPGLLLRDPSGIRILSPLAQQPPVLRFGPTDDCSIGIDPALPGLIERDPTGLRLMGQNNQGRRLIFGPTMDCTIEVRPAGTPGAVAGLLLRDPSGIRILNPVSNGNHRIVFGPTDDCRIDVVPAGTAGAGMRVLEPRGVLFTTPTGGATQVTVNGPVNAQAFIQTSSRRFKHDVKPIEQPLEKIGKLQGVRFTWNEEKGGARDIGFIAEEVAKVVPELVAWEEDGKNARGVNYAQLVAVTVEGIKEQQTRIERQQAAINSLKDENAALQDRLERLEKLVGDLSTVKTTAQQDHEH